MKISGQVWTGERTTPPKATVKVQKGQGQMACETCEVTTETGKYELAVALAAGTYTLKAYDSEGQWMEDTKICVLKEGIRNVDKDTKVCVLYEGTNDNVDFTLGKPVRRVPLSGTIRNSAGSRLASVEVILSLLDCEGCVIRRTRTDETGEYKASELAARSYKRVVVFEGSSSQPEEIDLRVEKAYKADLIIDKQGSQLLVFAPPYRNRGFNMPDMAATNIGRSIMGRFVDVNGAVLPGITVSVTREGGRSQTTTTDEDGIFRFFNLEPGSYTVEGEPSRGFARFIQTDVQVSLSTASIVKAQVQPANVTSTVDVIGTAGVLIDTNTTGSSVSSQQISSLPTQRTIQPLYTIAPTVTRSGLSDATGRDRDLSVAGSSGRENNYFLDGVNTTDPTFGGSGVNLPTEFVQEIEIKTGAYGPEYGKSTGGIFNIITKSGTNEFRGDIFGYATTKSLVRQVKNFPYTGSAFNAFSGTDVGGDIGGPVVEDKLWFFAAFNPQRRTNFYLTQTLHEPRHNKVIIPYYAGKLTWALNNNNTFTATTFADFTKVEGFLGTGTLTNASGFGSDPRAFEGRQDLGGHNYGFLFNSTIKSNLIAEFSGGLRFQRTNTTPTSTAEQLVNDNFAVTKGGGVLPVVQTGVDFGDGTGFIDFVDGRGGSLQRNFLRGPGFGLFSKQERNGYQINARFQNIVGNHTMRWGIEWLRNTYHTDTRSSGPDITYGNPLGLPFTNGADTNQTHGARTTNNFLVCTIRGTEMNCPSNAGVLRAQSIPAATLASLGLTVNGTANPITIAEALNNPFLIRNTTRVRDFQLVGKTHTDVESFYVQHDFKFHRDWMLNIGARWDFQQADRHGGATHITLNNFWDNLAPRLGLRWDFTGEGRSRIYANYAVFVEAPIPLDLIHRAVGEFQTDKNFNVNQYSAPPNATIVPGVSTGAVNLGSRPASVDPGLKPKSIGEATFGFEYEIVRDLTLGARGSYRYLRQVIEDGSFDDGETFFIFNPGRNDPGTSERLACEGDPAAGRAPRCFGSARRYYRAVELAATKRFTNQYQFMASYVFSSLIGNYEGLFRNDNGQSEPTISSLFDLPSLLDNTYGRLPNDRPHQFKFHGSYQTPFKVLLSGSFYMQSGTPFNMLNPHPIYGNNAGFRVQRGTAIVPAVTASQPGFPNVVESIGSNRTPTTMNLDLGFYYTIQLGEKRWLRLTGDWFNAFNRQRAVTLDQTFSINSGIEGVAPVVNPFWGAAVLVQPPSSFRFGAKFTF